MTNKRPSAPPSAVRRIMRKHGLPKPTARAITTLAFGEHAIRESEFRGMPD